MPFDNIDFEFDSKTVVDAFNNDREKATEFGYVISACVCKRSFASHFTNSQFEFSRRLANKLTKAALAGVTNMYKSTH